MGKSRRIRSGITRRWLRGSLLITVLLVMLAEGLFFVQCDPQLLRTGYSNPCTAVFPPLPVS